MNSLASAALLVTPNPLHKKCPTGYFLHFSCFSLRNSVQQKSNTQEGLEQRVNMCNLFHMKDVFLFETSGQVQGWIPWSSCRAPGEVALTSVFSFGH